MQPERNKAQSLARRQLAAKTHLAAAFGSLRGFPVRDAPGGWMWMRVPRFDGSPQGRAGTLPGPLPSEPELREAAIAVASLPKTFPRVWKDVVGSVNEWQAQSHAAIEALRAVARHDGGIAQLLPQTPAIASAASAGDASPFGAALAWAFIFDPLGAMRVARHAAALEATYAAANGALASPGDLARLIQWAELLAEHSPGAIRPWLDAWSEPDDWKPPTAPKPTAAAGNALPPHRRPDAPHSHARLRFNLYPLLAATVARERVPVMALLTALPRRAISMEEIERIAAMLLRTSDERMAVMRRIIRRCASDAEAVDAIATEVLRWCDGREPLTPWLRAVAERLEQPLLPVLRPADWIAASQELEEEWWYSQRQAFRPDLLLSAFASLMATHRDLALHSIDTAIGALGDVCRLVSDPSVVARSVGLILTRADLKLSDTNELLPRPLQRAAWHMARADPERFVAISVAMAKVRRGAVVAAIGEHAVDVAERLASASIPFEWLGDLAHAGHAKSVLEFLEAVEQSARARVDLARLLEEADTALRGDKPPAATTASGGLHERWATLASEEPAAGRAFAEALNRELPSRNALEQELEAVTRLLATSADHPPEHLRRRRDSLHQRLASDGTLTPAREERVLARARITARRLRLQAWCGALVRANLRWLETELRLEIPGEWLGEELTMRCLRGIVALDPEYLHLGRLLLAERATGRWSGSLPHPANDAWVIRARSGGVDIDAWLRGPDAMDADHPALGRLRIGLERDPLEILKIGAWFGTCLGPHDYNYFSTLVIAADANKHVLVVRNAKGTPIARRILALDRSFRLWAFRLYTHCTDSALERLVAAFVDRLGLACGAQPNGIDTVEPLTASEWYDDEPQRDVDHFLAMVRRFPEPTALLGALRESCSDRVVSTRVIDWISSYEATRTDRWHRGTGSADRPKLSAEVLGELLRFADPNSLRERNISSLLAAIRATRDHELLGRLLAQCRRRPLGDADLALAFVASGDPIEAMRVLRRCKGWQLLHRADLLEALGEAQWALGRRRRALDSLRRAVRHAWRPETIARLTKRIAEFERAQQQSADGSSRSRRA
jgi:hypothetical protein